MPFYGLYVAEKKDESPNSRVFSEKFKALRALRQSRCGRLREFTNEKDAVEFVKAGDPPIKQQGEGNFLVDVSGDKIMFRAPTRQELIELTKVIEYGDYDRIKRLIWGNPRLLVSPGHTPTTIIEGHRYNVMHVCAIFKKPKIAELILQTISDNKFIELLTGKKMCQEIYVNLIDYYLNIPEDWSNETPVHLAAKYGDTEMVELLTSYAQCKMAPNSKGLFPKDIVCARVENASQELRERIEFLLEERFYVPVLRSVDGTIPPKIGQPFSAHNPPDLNVGVLGVELKIQALAGPMTKEQAKQFFRRWKTPPRLVNNSSSSISLNLFKNPIKSYTTRINKSTQSDSPGSPMLKSPHPALANSTSQCSTLPTTSRDSNNSIAENVKNSGNSSVTVKKKLNQKVMDRAAEVIEIKKNKLEVRNKKKRKGRRKESLAQATRRNNLNMLSANLISVKQQRIRLVKLTENIPTVNFSIFCERTLEDPGFNERHIKIVDIEKGFETIGRKLAKEFNIEWREHWDFLDLYVDIASDEGLRELESYFKRRMEEDEMLVESIQTVEESAYTSDVEIETVEADSVATAETAVTTPKCTAPYSTVETSMQLLAKHMTKIIVSNINNEGSFHYYLPWELTRLKSLICSFRKDPYFLNMNFAKVHSRIANLISIYLQNCQVVTIDMKSKIEDEIKNRLAGVERHEHFECVYWRILNMLHDHINETLPESMTSEEICAEVWEKEENCECQWEVNPNEKINRQNHIEERVCPHQHFSNMLGCDYAIDLPTHNDEHWFDSTDDSEETYWTCESGSENGSGTWSTPMDLDKNVEIGCFIYGIQPTKRDVDVLHAICDIIIDAIKYPHITLWKKSMLRYTKEQMEKFPSHITLNKSDKSDASMRVLLDRTSDFKYPNMTADPNE